MHIVKRTGSKTGRVSYRVHVHFKGKHLAKVFRDRKVGERWGRLQETAIESTGMVSPIEEQKKHTVGEIVRKYLARIIRRMEADVA
jgi:hypothetical protein